MAVFYDVQVLYIDMDEVAVIDYRGKRPVLTEIRLSGNQADGYVYWTGTESKLPTPVQDGYAVVREAMRARNINMTHHNGVYQTIPCDPSECVGGSHLYNMMQYSGGIVVEDLSRADREDRFASIRAALEPWEKPFYGYYVDEVSGRRSLFIAGNDRPIFKAKVLKTGLKCLSNYYNYKDNGSVYYWKGLRSMIMG